MARNYGKIAFFKFNVELREVTLRAQDFYIEDSLYVRFVPIHAWLMPDYCTVRLEFTDFNAAYGLCKACYSPGTLISWADKFVPYTEFEFMPVGLIPPSEPAPVPTEVYNIENTVFVVFDAELLPIQNPAAINSVKARFQTRRYAPDGEIITVERSPVQVIVETYGKLSVTFQNGNQNDLSCAIGDVTIVYNGGGGLTAGGNPVGPFEFDFTPVGLVQKPDQMHTEHIEVTNISASGTLTAITYHDTKAADEHIEIVGITATGVLTDIGDI